MSENYLNEINDNDFDEKINEGTVVVDFYAKWCAPCKTLTPILNEVAEQLKGKVLFFKVDIDNNHATAQTHKVTSVPTLILFKNGKEINRLIGLQKPEAIKDFALA